MGEVSRERIASTVWEEEVKAQVLKDAARLVEEWPDLDLVERSTRLSGIIGRTVHLAEAQQTALRHMFASAKICTPREFTRMLAEALNLRDEKREEKECLCARFPSLVDLVWDEGQVKYLVLRDENLLVVDGWTDENGKILRPPDREAIPYELVDASLILSMEGDDTGELYQETVELLKRTSILPSEPYYHLCAIYIFFTYLSEKAPYFPYLWFFGLPERGKSRILKVMTTLAWRGLYSETLNEAYIFRFADLFAGTLGLDIYEISERAQKKGSHDLLLGRYEQGMKVARVIAPDRGPFRDTLYFLVSGPTMIATNVDIPARDPLRSRCIRITMPEARGTYPNIRSNELERIRCRLLAWRAWHLSDGLVNVEKPVPGRLGDLIQPLLSVAALLPSEARQQIYHLLNELEQERTQAEAETLAGRIAEALHLLRNKVTGAKLPVERLREEINKGIDERYWISPQRLGHELSALGIERKKIQGVMHIVWANETMDSIFSRFKLVEDISPISPNSPNGVVEPKDRGEIQNGFSPISPGDGRGGRDVEGRLGETRNQSPPSNITKSQEKGREGREGRSTHQEGDEHVLENLRKAWWDCSRRPPRGRRDDEGQ